MLTLARTKCLLVATRCSSRSGALDAPSSCDSSHICSFSAVGKLEAQTTVSSLAMREETESISAQLCAAKGQGLSSASASVAGHGPVGVMVSPHAAEMGANASKSVAADLPARKTQSLAENATVVENPAVAGASTSSITPIVTVASTTAQQTTLVTSGSTAAASTTPAITTATTAFAHPQRNAPRLVSSMP